MWNKSSEAKPTSSPNKSTNEVSVEAPKSAFVNAPSLVNAAAPAAVNAPSAVETSALVQASVSAANFREHRICISTVK